jgi:hypothetical protein
MSTAYTSPLTIGPSLWLFLCCVHGGRRLKSIGVQLAAMLTALRNLNQCRHELTLPHNFEAVEGGPGHSRLDPRVVGLAAMATSTSPTVLPRAVVSIVAMFAVAVAVAVAFPAAVAVAVAVVVADCCSPSPTPVCLC